MPVLGAMIAIIEDGRILLTKRDDFEVWCLPGGAVDPGESVAQAAQREAREEVGLEVELTRLIGIYSKPLWQGGGSHLVLFGGHVVGGTLRLAPGETIDARYFAPHELPEDMFWWHRRPVADAFAGVGGSAAVSMLAPWPLDAHAGRAEVYAQRDQSGMSRLEFYRRFFATAAPQTPVDEVPVRRGA